MASLSRSNEENSPTDHSRPRGYVLAALQARLMPQHTVRAPKCLPLLAAGTVVRVLSDDNDSSRHQRFILELANGHTLLIAHNIDLAPRVPNLKSGDTVHFSGQYEDNDRGGFVHWTHHDPQQQHIGGWLQHNGNVYE